LFSMEQDSDLMSAIYAHLRRAGLDRACTVLRKAGVEVPILCLFFVWMVG